MMVQAGDGEASRGRLVVSPHVVLSPQFAGVTAQFCGPLSPGHGLPTRSTLPAQHIAGMALRIPRGSDS